MHREGRSDRAHAAPIPKHVCTWHISNEPLYKENI